MSYIYLITNTVNGKRYIGQTKHNVNKRWQDHQKAAKRHQRKNESLPVFQRAILKYGHDKFVVSVLEECTDNIAFDREVVWIKRLSPEYNMTKGGEHSWNEGLTKQDNEKLASIGKKISQRMIGNIPWNKGKEWSEEVRQKLRGPRPKLSLAMTGKKWKKDTYAKKSNHIEYNGNIYYGWPELEKRTGVTKHLYKKYYLNGIDPLLRKGTVGPPKGFKPKIKSLGQPKMQIEYNGKVYYGWKEFEKNTKISRHLYLKYCKNGINPISRVGKTGPIPRNIS